MIDEVKIAVRFQCNKYNQKECTGYTKSPKGNYCVYGLYEKLCYNETLRMKYFVKECERRFCNKGINCEKESCSAIL